METNNGLNETRLLGPRSGERNANLEAENEAMQASVLYSSSQVCHFAGQDGRRETSRGVSWLKHVIAIYKRFTLTSLPIERIGVPVRLINRTGVALPALR